MTPLTSGFRGASDSAPVAGVLRRTISDGSIDTVLALAPLADLIWATDALGSSLRGSPVSDGDPAMCKPDYLGVASCWAPHVNPNPQRSLRA